MELNLSKLGSNEAQRTSNLFLIYFPFSIDGFWQSWTQWSDCSVSCSAGFRARIRICGVARFGGNRTCGVDGSNDKEILDCHLGPCPGINNLSPGRLLPLSKCSQLNACSKTILLLSNSGVVKLFLSRPNISLFQRVQRFLRAPEEAIDTF